MWHKLMLLLIERCRALNLITQHLTAIAATNTIAQITLMQMLMIIVHDVIVMENWRVVCSGAGTNVIIVICI
jgi:hypothetical protein